MPVIVGEDDEQDGAASTTIPSRDPGQLTLLGAHLVARGDARARAGSDLDSMTSSAL